MLTAALAFLLAVLGTIGVLAYVRGANQRAIQGIKAVSVLVASKEIPSGTTANTALRDGLLSLQRLPESSVPPDALPSLSGVGSLVTSAAVHPGQVLLRPMLVVASQATAGVAIPPGKLAVTVQMCLPAAVAGFIHAGSQVAVFDTYGDKNLNVQETCGQSHQAAATGSVHTRIVLTKVEVLSVGSAPNSISGSQTASSTVSDAGQAAETLVLVTLAVDQNDAERVITLDQAGLPYLGLLTSQSKTAFDTQLVPLFQAGVTGTP
jgi:pilus assembly protein CpaB